jgi:3-methyladenine DNA glycosylase AlkD
LTKITRLDSGKRGPPRAVSSRAKAARPKVRPAPHDVEAKAAYAVKWLQQRGTAANREGMARYGIVAKKVIGVSVGTLRSLAKELGRDHALAKALWKTGYYEARMLSALVGEAERVTPAEMERYAKTFDNWAICDTMTFALWDRSPHAWAKVREWSKRDEEFVKRASFAMLASLTVHDKSAPDERYLEGLRLIEREATDNRNFVKKAVNWALRSIGKRSRMLNKEAIAIARRLATSGDPAARWVGKDALRELTSPAVQRRLSKKKRR